GFARAGFLVLVPDLPGLGEGQISWRTLDSAAAIVEAALARPDVRGGRIALCGASAGAGVALLLAARPELAGRVSVVASVSPFADLERMVCLATTSCYEAGETLERYEVQDLLRRVVARSLLGALPGGAERDDLLA